MQVFCVTETSKCVQVNLPNCLCCVWYLYLQARGAGDVYRALFWYIVTGRWNERGGGSFLSPHL